MTLHVHRSERTDHLAAALGEMLAAAPADPFAAELVVVPARGVERWLAQTLAHRLGADPERPGAQDGVSAGVRFVSPGSLVSLLLDRDRDDPWGAQALAWPVLAAIDRSLDEGWAAPLAAHLGDGAAEHRRYAVARRLAGLLASYAAQRPVLLEAWSAGESTDGLGEALPDDLAWQPELWRRVADDVAAATGVPTPATRWRSTVAALRSRQHDPAEELPERLSLFGHTRLSRPDAELLAALGERREVHLWLPQASAALWERWADSAAAGPVRRRAVDPEATARHPLLDTLGRDSRELQRTLGGLVASDRAVSPGRGAESGTAGRPAGGVDIPADSSLLALLQADLRADRVPDADLRRRRVLDVADRSVQVHACHGWARQIEVLREVLLGLLADDPTLEPRDIIVLCPDVERAAPLVHAAFGLAAPDGAPDPGAHPGHRLRVRLADRAPMSVNPLIGVAVALVDLAGGRATAAEVLDLAAAAPVRRRFGLDDDDLEQVGSWIRGSGVRWGLDDRHRAAFGLDLREHTWEAGLDRLLLGVAMADEDGRHLGATLPLDDVEGSRVDLAGRLAELVARLRRFLRSVEDGASVDDWLDALLAAVHAIAEVPADDAWQRAQLDREVARARAAADRAGEQPRVRAPDVRFLLHDLLAGRPTRSNFRTGTLTVCTMVPMRSVPHRVVCIVGLDDGVFPRAPGVDGDDVLARDPLTGERDVRAEDRQLLLDAILAAREHLVVTYTGNHELSGAVRPPAVPLGEVLDALDATATPPAPVARVRDHVLVRHPLQPYAEQNLQVKGPGRPAPFSFDPTALAGALAARAARGDRIAGLPRPRERLVPQPLATRAGEDVQLDELRAFLVHPVRAFLRQRLDVASSRESEELPVRIPIDLDALSRWGVGDRLLAAVLAGASPQQAMFAEQLRGELPPGAPGRAALAHVVDDLRAVHAAAVPLTQTPARSVDVDVALGGGRRLRGTVDGVRGSRVVRVGFSRLGPRARLESWVDLLALSVAFPDEHWTAQAVGRGPRRSASQTLLGPLDHRAEEWLAELVDVYDRGLCEPLPLPLKTAAAYAEERRRERGGMPVADVWERARGEWETPRFADGSFPREDRDVDHVRAFGVGATLDDLLQAPPLEDEQWWPGESTRLGQLALRLWMPLLEAGRVGAA